MSYVREWERWFNSLVLQSKRYGDNTNLVVVRAEYLADGLTHGDTLTVTSTTGAIVGTALVDFDIAGD